MWKKWYCKLKKKKQNSTKSQRFKKSSKFPRKYKSIKLEKDEKWRKENRSRHTMSICCSRTKQLEARRLQDKYQKLSQSWETQVSWKIQVTTHKEPMKCKTKGMRIDSYKSLHNTVTFQNTGYNKKDSISFKQKGYGSFHLGEISEMQSVEN